MSRPSHISAGRLTSEARRSAQHLTSAGHTAADLGGVHIKNDKRKIDKGQKDSIKFVVWGIVPNRWCAALCQKGLTNKL